MPKDIHVLLIEDDPYARDLMGMLLTRDWRTRIVGEVGSEDDVKRILEIPFQRVDAIILDTEVPGDPDWPFRVAEFASSQPQAPRILCTATKANPDTLGKILNHDFGGYVLKSEVKYALAAAVARTTKFNEWILTPAVYSTALQWRHRLPDNAVVLDGSRKMPDLTDREAEIARLAILFNHPHRDLADELLIRADQVSKHVSNTYDKLGLNEILNGEIEPEAFFEDKVVLRHFQSILDRVASSGSRRKTADMATLAFHLLTKPDLREPS